MLSVPDVAEILRSDFHDEAAAGFPTLYRTPSSDVVRLLDYFADLDVAARDAFLDVTARLAATRLVLSRDAEAVALSASDPALLRYRASMQEGSFAYGMRYQSLRMARAMLGDAQSMQMVAQTRASLSFAPRDEPPSWLTDDPDIRRNEPAKAPLLRKLLQPALTSLLSATKSKLPGGETRYSGTLDGSPIAVTIDFAARDVQLHWSVGLSPATPGSFVARIDDFWGNGRWDYITAPRAPQAVELLCDRVRYFRRLKARLEALA